MTTEADLLGRPPIMRPIARPYGRQIYDQIDKGDGRVSVQIPTSGQSQHSRGHQAVTMPAIPLTESRRGG